MNRKSRTFLAATFVAISLCTLAVGQVARQSGKAASHSGETSVARGKYIPRRVALPADRDPFHDLARWEILTSANAAIPDDPARCGVRGGVSEIPEARAQIIASQTATSADVPDRAA